MPSIVVSSTPNDGGIIAWITANRPIPAANAGSREDRNSRQTGGNFFQQFEPFSAWTVFKRAKSGRVAARPCQAQTSPAPTGSMTFANTIGTLRVICCNAVTFVGPSGN